MEELIIETDKEKANQLYNSQEWSKPEWSEKKGCYIIIKKARYRGMS